MRLRTHSVRLLALIPSREGTFANGLFPFPDARQLRLADPVLVAAVATNIHLPLALLFSLRSHAEQTISTRDDGWRARSEHAHALRADGFSGVSGAHEPSLALALGAATLAADADLLLAYFRSTGTEARITLFARGIWGFTGTAEIHQLRARLVAVDSNARMTILACKIRALTRASEVDLLRARPLAVSIKARMTILACKIGSVTRATEEYLSDAGLLTTSICRKA